MAEQDDEGRLSNENGGSLSASGRALHLLRLTLDSVFLRQSVQLQVFDRTQLTERTAGDGCKIDILQFIWTYLIYHSWTCSIR